MANYPTLHSIAKACGVSHVTVSRALRGQPNVNPRTAERIRAHAAQVGYKVNKLARSLAEGRAGTIAFDSGRSIIVPYNKATGWKDEDYVFWKTVEGIVEAAAQSDYRVEILGFETADEFRRVRQAVEEERALGVIELGLQSETVDYLAASGVPMVSSLFRAGNNDPRRKARVSCDHIEGYVLAWRHLIGLGHERFGYVGLAHRPEGSVAHRQECLAASQLLGTPPTLGPSAMIEGIDSADAIWDALVTTFGERGDGGWPTAVFCVNDHVASWVISTLQSRGLVVPRDLSVFGFGDFPSAQASLPGVTTIRIPRKEIAAAMFWTIADIIAGRQGERYISQILPMPLVERESTGPPPRVKAAREGSR